MRSGPGPSLLHGIPARSHTLLCCLLFTSSCLLNTASGFRLMASLTPPAHSTRPKPSFFRAPGVKEEIKYPIVWTIAGSDSGGGAGIQADLHAFQAFHCHGCSVITALTSQNSRTVRSVAMTPLPHLRDTMDVLKEDLPPRAIKVGMLGNAETASEVGSYLRTLEGPIVVDPVMVSTSGSKLLDERARSVLVSEVFPYATLITPNRLEAELLVGYELKRAADYERAARDLLAQGQCKAVLIKGGHHEGEDGSEGGKVVQDYLLIRDKGIWFTGPRLESSNTHGTGCSLSSSIAALLAQGHPLADAVMLGKAYVSQGIGASVQLGQGPGPVRHTAWPHDHTHLPWVTDSASLALSPSRPGPFPPCPAPGCAEEEGPMGLYACVDSVEWVERLAKLGVRDIQLRIKDQLPAVLDESVGRAVALCREHHVRLWVNDYWGLAVKHKAYGLHIGQEDLVDLLAQGPDGSPSKLDQVRGAGVRLGVSTHNWEELGRALSLRPSYISLGPIFHTNSKDVQYPPQGFDRISQWRQCIPPSLPLVVIGGVSAETAETAVKAGADSICVISALTKASDLPGAVKTWQRFFSQ